MRDDDPGGHQGDDRQNDSEQFAHTIRLYASISGRFQPAPSGERRRAASFTGSTSTNTTNKEKE
jgi:hypothetical protein